MDLLAVFPAGPNYFCRQTVSKLPFSVARHNYAPRVLSDADWIARLANGSSQNWAGLRFNRNLRLLRMLRFSHLGRGALISVSPFKKSAP